MIRRSEEMAAPRQPVAPWVVGAMIGLAISTLATGAVMLGAGLAISEAAMRGK